MRDLGRLSIGSRRGRGRLCRPWSSDLRRAPSEAAGDVRLRLPDQPRQMRKGGVIGLISLGCMEGTIRCSAKDRRCSRRETIDFHEAPSRDLVADDGFLTDDDTPGGEMAIWGLTRLRRISARANRPATSRLTRLETTRRRNLPRRKNQRPGRRWCLSHQGVTQVGRWTYAVATPGTADATTTLLPPGGRTVKNLPENRREAPLSR